MSATNLPTLAFIGGGNMARSLIGGLRRRNWPAAAIRVAEPNAELRKALHTDYGVSTYASNAEAAAAASIWVLAVKPQVLPEVCAGLAALAQTHRPTIVSIAAGISSTQIDAWLGGGLAIVRCMPNTPALIGAGVTGMFANARVSSANRAQIVELMQTVGACVEIADEALMDAVTAVSGSGPAYVFLLAECWQAAAQAQGLPADTARILVEHTLYGAARMLRDGESDAATLRARVTSPGGTTQAAIEQLLAGAFPELFAKAIAAAVQRGRELAGVQSV